MRRYKEIEEWILHNLRYKKRALISEKVIERYGGEEQMLDLLEAEGYPCIITKVQRRNMETMMSEQFYNVENIHH